MIKKLLSAPNANAKIAKSNKSSQWLSTILHLAPYMVSGFQTCASASAGCASACLNTAGRSAFGNVQRARIAKTKLLFENREEFKRILFKDIAAFIKKSDKEGKKPAIRLNGTSDLLWESLMPDLFTDFSSVQFYDYTKHYLRMKKFCEKKLPQNYHLTFSRSEKNEKNAIKILEMGGNVAAVFGTIPTEWKKASCANGDNTDLRFLDSAQVCGLSAKGAAKYDLSGFVILTKAEKKIAKKKLEEKQKRDVKAIDLYSIQGV